MPPNRRRIVLATVIVLAAAAAAVSALAAEASPARRHAPRHRLRAAAPGHTGVSQLTPHLSTGVGSVLAATSRRPNIVFVLTDDLSMNLLRYMPEVQALATRGMTFSNYFVSDSLCCPSRTSIFTGEYPHDTGVFTNDGYDGGMTAFVDHGDMARTFNIALQQAGYRTAMMGKYINGYLQGPNRSPVPSTFVPPGWNEWDVAGWGYPEFNYTLNENGRLHYFGHQPSDYLTSVLGRRAVSFINRSANGTRPFFLEVATFSPHTPYVPAPRDKHLFPGLTAPRPPSFDQLPQNPPSWLAGHQPLRPRQIARINKVFRLRVQDVQSVDRLISRIEETLAARGLLKNTYIMFSSDNGLHTGEYRLMPGKLTAFDTDIHVPLVVAGPGIPAGSTNSLMTENVDLAETFTQIGGATFTTGDGHSLSGLLNGVTPTDWRNAVLIEHHGPSYDPAINPDAQNFDSGNPTTYEAMRTPDFLYVEYINGEREFYDLRTDPFELDNIAGQLSQTVLAELHSELVALEECHGGAACWAAGHVAMPPGA